MSNLDQQRQNELVRRKSFRKGRDASLQQHGNDAERLSRLFGDNLRRLRRRGGHSLSRLSALSGVSRAMLGQIENGQSIPSVIVACKVAVALAVPLQALLEGNQKPRISVMRRDEQRSEATGCLDRRLLLASGGSDAVEVTELRLAAGRREKVGADSNCRKVFLTLTAGDAVVRIGTEPAIALQEGDAVSFDGGFDNCVTNSGHADAVLIAVVITSPASA